MSIEKKYRLGSTLKLSVRKDRVIGVAGTTGWTAINQTLDEKLIQSNSDPIVNNWILSGLVTTITSE